MAKKHKLKRQNFIDVDAPCAERCGAEIHFRLFYDDKSKRDNEFTVEFAFKLRDTLYAKAAEAAWQVENPGTESCKIYCPTCRTDRASA